MRFAFSKHSRTVFPRQSFASGSAPAFISSSIICRCSFSAATCIHRALSASAPRLQNTPAVLCCAAAPVRKFWLSHTVSMGTQSASTHSQHRHTVSIGTQSASATSQHRQPVSIGNQSAFWMCGLEVLHEEHGCGQCRRGATAPRAWAWLRCERYGAATAGGTHSRIMQSGGPSAPAL